MEIGSAQRTQGGASSSFSRKENVIQSLQDTPDDSLVIFRVANKRPHLRKRPLASVDGILPHDMTIRIYDVISMNPEAAEVSAVPSKHQDLPLVHLFNKMRDDVCQDMLLHMQQWQMRDALPLRFASHVTGLCSAAENMLRELLEARAVEGTGKTFDASCFSQEDSGILDVLLQKNLVKRCGEQDIVLSKDTLQCDAVHLHQPLQVDDDDVVFNLLARGGAPMEGRGVPADAAAVRGDDDRDTDTDSACDASDDDSAEARTGVGRHGQSRRDAIALVLPKVTKYLRKHHAAAARAAEELQQVQLVREALRYYAARKRKYIVWGDEGQPYKSRYNVERAIVNLYWQDVVAGLPV
ncbi:unnamed protein product [Symbiodinium sp. CCMP2456]|nr:unnamed protein product [Symbiodinium sp. CCMP2456]